MRGFDYNRVEVLLHGLKQVADGAYEVYEFGKRTKEAGEEIRRRSEHCDIIYIPPFRQRDVAFVKSYCNGKPVVFDPLIGTTITRVIDFGYWWRGPYARWKDRRDFRAADHLIFDTNSHKSWAINTLQLNPATCHTLYIGAVVEQFRSNLVAVVRHEGPTLENPIRVGFYGSLAPLQGVEVIIEAAHLLRDRKEIVFELIGNIDRVAKLNKLRRRLPSGQVVYTPYLPYEQLAERVQRFDICLGVFGKSLKADVVIPNKVYHYAAAGKAIITRESVGIEELFTNGDNIWEVGTTAEELADAIRLFAERSDLRVSLGESAAALVDARLSSARIAQDFLAICASILTGQPPL